MSYVAVYHVWKPAPKAMPQAPMAIRIERSDEEMR